MVTLQDLQNVIENIREDLEQHNLKLSDIPINKDTYFEQIKKINIDVCEHDDRKFAIINIE
jgi:Fe-S cluster assembly scaffold protein SufB